MLLSALACLLLLSTIAAPPARTAGTLIRVMPLGDSITWGQLFGLTQDHWAGYRYPLDQRLSAAGLSIEFVGSGASGPDGWANNRHEGHGTYSTQLLLQGLPGWIAAAHPQVILLQAGVPDRLEAITPIQFADRYRALLLAIQQADPTIETIASSLTPATSPPIAAAATAPFNAVIPSVVAERRAAGQRVRYVDVGGQVPASELADGTHPTIAGYQRLADGWFSALQDVITHPSAACNPRPRVTIESAPVGSGVIRITATTTGQSGAIRAVTLGAGRNVQPVTDLAIVGGRATFTVHRTSPTGAYTQPFAVTDQCGPWSSFVGAGG